MVGVDLFDGDAESKACTAKYKVQYPVLRGTEAGQIAWIGSPKASGTSFVTPDGKVLKKILESIDIGLEGPVFSKFVEYMLAKP